MADSFYPGRSLVPHLNLLPFNATMRIFPPKASPLRVVLRAANLKSNDCRGQSHLNSKLSRTRLFGTESLTDVGDLPPVAAGGRPRVAPTFVSETQKKGTTLGRSLSKCSVYSSTYWMAMQPGPPWVMKAGLRGTISNWASGMAVFSAARAWSAFSGAAAWEM